jgi:hypothetical protein
LGRSTQRLRYLAAIGRIPGAQKIGRGWLLPDKPKIVPARVGRAPKASDQSDPEWWR